MRVLSTFRAIEEEWRNSAELCGDWRSRLRLMSDYLLSHVLFAVPSGMVNRERRVKTKAGVHLSYRLNRGDLQGIREVWFQEVYRLPFAVPSGALLDLGANIGLTTLWMATHGHFSKIVAIEPDHENAALVAKNLQQNGIRGEVIEAAVGPKDGTISFRKASWSNLGTCVESAVNERLADDETSVRMVCVETVLNECGLERLGVVKVDIEGSEQALFLGPSEWLDCVSSMIVEFHPHVVDYPLLVETLKGRGFDYFAPNLEHTDCFLRSAM